MCCSTRMLLGRARLWTHIQVDVNALNSATSVGLRESGSGTVFTIQINGVDTPATWTDSSLPQAGYIGLGTQSVSAPYTTFSQVSSNKPLVT